MLLNGKIFLNSTSLEFFYKNFLLDLNDFVLPSG